MGVYAMNNPSADKRERRVEQREKLRRWHYFFCDGTKDVLLLVNQFSTENIRNLGINQAMTVKGRSTGSLEDKFII